MKTKAFKRASALAVLAVAAIPAIYAIPNNVIVSAEEADSGIASWSVEDCYSFMSEMPDELNDFVSGYNNVADADNCLNAESIEYSTLVYIEDIENYGVYFDFDGDNGYAVITPEKTVYGLNTDCDLDYLKDCDELHFSSMDGFLYKDDDGVLQRFEVEGVEDNETNSASTSVTDILEKLSKIFPGQDMPGDGEIYASEIYTYVSERYPKYKYVNKAGRTQSNLDWVRQITTSYYTPFYADENGNYTVNGGGEGNCVLNAMYNMLIDWGKRNFVRTPYLKTDNIIDTIKSDSLYSRFGIGMVYPDLSDGKVSTMFLWRTNYDTYLMNMPVVYSNIRGYAVSKGYTVNGYEHNKVPSTLEFVANTLYGNNIEVKYTTSASEAMKYVRQNKACYLGINGSITYKDHGVAILGYYQYVWEVPFGSFNMKIDHYFYEVADGWNYDSRIFDPNMAEDISLAFCYLARC